MEIKAPSRYKYHPGHADQVYSCLCKVLSGRGVGVDWAAFTPMDWDLLDEMAQQESVGPLLYAHFKHGSWPDGIPTRVAGRLMQQYFGSLAYNQSLYKKLEELLEFFQQAQLPVILLKGIVFAKALYAHIALRPMLDIDLLVRRGDLAEAIKILTEMGFVEHFRDFQAGLSEHVAHHYHFESENHLALELHWNLISGDKDWRTPPENWIWSNREETSVIDRKDLTVWCLNLPATLLYQAAHMALQHGLSFSRLIWFFDVNSLITEHAQILDWGALVKSAQELGWVAALWAVLEETKKRFDAPIPEWVLEKLCGIEAPDSALVKRKIALDLQYEQMAAELASLDWISRIKVIIARLFPSPAYIQYNHHPQPGWLLPLYYPYRWLTISLNVIQMLVSRIIKA